ncbi:rna exonuclease [Spiromyces aspiralis]|uniref:Rna exonuclease n=1 Tax=Spiromyces aspiralis TaxID=68401 RepID=A0ACC1HQJ2_9FUNG|nr:rna exonuclease [Spiromyces aspiralis]
MVLDLIKKHISKKGIGILAGNSVHVDRMFLARQMPRLVDYLTYRIIDVSSVKELARRWAPQIFANAPKKQGTHRALDDILESIEELRYYKDKLFKL